MLLMLRCALAPSHSIKSVQVIGPTFFSSVTEPQIWFDKLIVGRTPIEQFHAYYSSWWGFQIECGRWRPVIKSAKLEKKFKNLKYDIRMFTFYCIEMRWPQ